jgi:hypothetical protein
MIVHPAEQRTEEWKQARIGVVTASQFYRLITPKGNKPAAAAGDYLNELIAEWILGEPLDGASSGMIERGRAMENEAVEWYEFTRDVTVDRVGLCLRDDKLVGASPDGLIGEDGLLEIKCPGAKKHTSYLLGGDLAGDHRCQVQGGLWVTGREWADLVSYNPAMPPVVIRCERDHVFIRILAGIVDGFTHRVAVAKTKIAEVSEADTT